MRNESMVQYGRCGTKMRRFRGGRAMTPAPRSHSPAMARSSELLPAPDLPMMRRCSPLVGVGVRVRVRVRVGFGVRVRVRVRAMVMVRVRLGSG